jgi:hypothetical protein
MFQHTKFSTIARKEGYTTDDNARALIAALKYNRSFDDRLSLRLAKTYLEFLLYMQMEDGSFHNVLGFDRNFKDEKGSEDSMGHALWACGYTLDSNAPEEMKFTAKEIFDKGLPVSRHFTSPRAKASSILGLHYYHKAYPRDQNLTVTIKELSHELISQFNIEADEKWPWFEVYLTYANARLPQSLLHAYHSLNDESCLNVALTSLNFLIKTQIINDLFIPIGSNGWYLKNGVRAYYDQQPIEASCLVEAAVEAYNVTGDVNYKKAAQTSFQWFKGKNTKNVVLINGETEICYDGITPEGLNKNQGAEATLSYYLAYLSLLEGKLL